jgi:hypothetical protein
MKIHPVGTEFTSAEGWTDTERQTDLTKLIVALRNFANASKRCLHECDPIFVYLAVKHYKTRYLTAIKRGMSLFYEVLRKEF